MSDHSDRRRDLRLRPPVFLVGTLGLLKVTIADLSRGGCRVRHAGAVRGSEVILRLRYGSVALTVPAEVLRTGIVELGEQAVYETRLQFVRLNETQAHALHAMLGELLELQERIWIRNAQGYPFAPETEPPAWVGRTFVRLVRTGAGWETVNTVSPEQPADGLTVPASLSHEDLLQLRICYAAGGQNLRLLLRACAAQACRDAAVAR